MVAADVAQMLSTCRPTVIIIVIVGTTTGSGSRRQILRWYKVVLWKDLSAAIWEGEGMREFF